MYVVEHKGEKKADSKSKEYHNSTDTTKPHYHIFVRFEPSHGTALEDIAKYLGVSSEVIEKPLSGQYSYPNSLSYLTHIKYENKIQYAPEDVVTLAGTDYMDYYNENKERWIKARAIKAKKRVRKLADLDWGRLYNKLRNNEISKEEAKTREEYRSAFKYCRDFII